MGLLFAKFIVYIYVFSCYCQEYNFKNVIIPKNLCLGTYKLMGKIKTVTHTLTVAKKIS